MRSSYAALLMLTALSMLGCVGVARISEMPSAASSIDFDGLAKRAYDVKDPIWNQKTESAYFIETASLPEDELIAIVTAALASLHYHVQTPNKESRAIFGKRGLRANEWGSAAGVYYRPIANGYQIYITVRITQDVTGGWRDNRAKKVADAICVAVKSCK